MEDMEIQWTNYFVYRANLRGFELARIEEIVRYSPERYLDYATGRNIAVGQHGGSLVLIAYESSPGILKPVTAHFTSRQQILNRVKSRRFRYE